MQVRAADAARLGPDDHVLGRAELGLGHLVDPHLPGRLEGHAPQCISEPSRRAPTRPRRGPLGAVIGDREDRRRGPVHRDNRPSTTDPGQMLPRAGDAEREIHRRPHGLSGLADAARPVDPAGVDDRAGAVTDAPRRAASCWSRATFACSPTPLPIDSRKSALVMSTPSVFGSTKPRCSVRGASRSIASSRMATAAFVAAAGANAPMRASDDRRLLAGEVELGLEPSAVDLPPDDRTAVPGEPAHVAGEAVPPRAATAAANPSASARGSGSRPSVAASDQRLSAASAT